MKRDNFLNYGHNKNISDILDNLVHPVFEKELDVAERKEGVDSLLSLVYALDPISKLPTGDLCYMVSDKANPEVKAFILQNLQFDTSSAANVTAPDGLSDDDIIELTRKAGESLDSYVDRVNIYMKNNITLLNAAVEQANKWHVSSQSEGSSVSSE